MLLLLAAAAATPIACTALDALANTPANAVPALTACLKRTAPGGTIALKPGRYTILSPLVVDRPVTLVSRGLARTAPACRANGDARCAVLAIGHFPGGQPANAMPIEVKAPNVTVSHVVIRGWSGRDPAYDKRICSNNATRALGGGMRVGAARFTLTGSAIRGVACYTALEITTAADQPTLTDNKIGPNGNHNPGEVWADGMTIHDTTRATVTGNSFLDNTDVQLIFGGCRACRITGNRFRHSGSFAGAAFAELMIHAWPTTSGNYDGTVVSGNDVDCGAARRCGYGLMIGAKPWYEAKASGGEIVGNHVANARMAINVDGLTGPMTIRDNRIATSGGAYDSACGRKTWPALNVSPASLSFVRGGAYRVGLNTGGCMLNGTPN